MYDVVCQVPATYWKPAPPAMAPESYSIARTAGVGGALVVLERAQKDEELADWIWSIYLNTSPADKQEALDNHCDICELAA